jgi:hypothetical protein
VIPEQSALFRKRRDLNGLQATREGWPSKICIFFLANEFGQQNADASAGVLRGSLFWLPKAGLGWKAMKPVVFAGDVTR